DMARTHKVIGGSGGVDQQLDRLDAVGGRHAGADAVLGMAIHTDGERRAPHAVVAGRLGLEVQTVAVGSGERHAKVSAADAGHEVDDFRRDLLRSADKVAFVFAVFIIHEHDDLTGSKLVKNLWNG